VLEPALSHPSVVALGHSDDVRALMRRSHVLVLPSIEEGFGLVCTEAMASGCVPLVSRACTDLCRSGENALVHQIGDVDALAAHLSLLADDRALLGRLREEGLAARDDVSWDAAGRRLAHVYADVAA
jgi:glycosyltransferase involved in cell wall biosynthesis